MPRAQEQPLSRPFPPYPRALIEFLEVPFVECLVLGDNSRCRSEFCRLIDIDHDQSRHARFVHGNTS